MKTKNFITALALLISFSVYSQKNWSKYDYGKEHKAKFSIGGASAKSLKNNKTFIAGYTISQATTMKGSERSATKSVFSEVSLGGLNNEEYQQMVDELYKKFVDELNNAGLQITDGKDVLKTDFVKAKLEKDRKDEYIGSTGENPAYEGKKKIQEGAMPGYGAWAVTRDVSFPPRNKNIYLTSNIIKSGNFYGKLSNKENYNLLIVNFYVSFASFDGGRGYKDIKLATKPVMAVSVQINLITPNGAFNKLYYKDLPLWADDSWSEGIVKTKDNKSTSEFLGLARSADYSVKANSEKYLSELKDIIDGFQKDIVKNIKENL